MIAVTLGQYEAGFLGIVWLLTVAATVLDRLVERARARRRGRFLAHVWASVNSARR